MDLSDRLSTPKPRTSIVMKKSHGLGEYTAAVIHIAGEPGSIDTGDHR